MIGHKNKPTLFVNSKELTQIEWHALLDALNVYDDLLQKASANFKISYEHAHELALIMQQDPWKPAEGVENSLKSYKNI